MNTISISTPGRICLFGEHQDYLQLPVIPAAISLRMYFKGTRRRDSIIVINLPDTKEIITIDLSQPIRYECARDYFRSGIAVLQKNGFTFSTGFDCTLQSIIPISAGASSSAALNVSWIHFLSRMSDEPQILTQEQIAQFAYQAEVLEFGEPGGMMDQYSTALGGIIHLTSFTGIKIQRLPTLSDAFILGDSLQPKDTLTILKRVKNGVLDIVNRLQLSFPDFSLQTVSISDLEVYAQTLTSDEKNLLSGTIRNRNIANKAFSLLLESNPDKKKIGTLLNEHHAILRDTLKISTPKIDAMLEAALTAGAYGGKINGSGGGGCMFVYAPECTQQVAEAIEKAGSKAYIIKCDEGTRLEQGDAV